MDSPHHRPTWWQRWLQRLVSTRPVTWFLAHTLHYIDRWLFRFLDGKTSLTSLVFGLPVVMLTTTGARSGLPRSVPLVGLVDGEKVVLIASNFGQANHP